MSEKKPFVPATDESKGGDKKPRRVVSMQRWLRLTARKQATAKTATNDSSKAAAEALAAMLGPSRRLG